MAQRLYRFALCLFIVVTFAEISQAQRTGVGTRGSRPIRFLSGQQGVLFDVAVYYGQSEATADPSAGNEWKDNTSIYDIKLGYISESGLYFGAEYSTRTQSANSILLNSSTGSTGAVGLGYFPGNGFHLRAFYRIDETFGDYKKGTGYQADLGYMVNMSSNFYLGFLISHRQTRFARNDLIANFDYWSRRETFPMLTAGFVIE